MRYDDDAPDAHSSRGPQDRGGQPQGQEPSGTTDSMAIFAGPEDEPPVSRHRSDQWDRETRGSFQRRGIEPRGSSTMRWVVRIAVPLVFVGGVVALVLLVTSSGVFDQSSSPSPSASATQIVMKVYVVKKGDTLSGIAEKHGVSIQAIIDANPSIDANNLRVKAKIKIPTPTQ